MAHLAHAAQHVDPALKHEDRLGTLGLSAPLISHRCERYIVCMNERERVFEWFSDFRKRVLAVLSAVDTLVPVDDVIEEWPEVGWHVFVGRLRSERRASFSLWLETYLDKDESHHLGCWYSTSPRFIEPLRVELARMWRVQDVPVYKHRHRAHARLHIHLGRAEATRIPAPLIDRWSGRNETYAGLYASRAPVCVFRPS
jgi:hypothetical protein